MNSLQAELNRWKLISVVLLTLIIGFIAGQSWGVSQAQTKVMKVQLDTSNCSISTDDKLFDKYTEIKARNVIGGGLSVYPQGKDMKVSWMTVYCK